MSSSSRVSHEPNKNYHIRGGQERAYQQPRKQYKVPLVMLISGMCIHVVIVQLHNPHIPEIYTHIDTYVYIYARICVYIIYDDEEVLAVLPSLNPIYSFILFSLTSLEPSPWRKFPCASMELSFNQAQRFNYPVLPFHNLL